MPISEFEGCLSLKLPDLQEQSLHVKARQNELS